MRYFGGSSNTDRPRDNTEMPADGDAVSLRARQVQCGVGCVMSARDAGVLWSEELEQW